MAAVFPQADISDHWQLAVFGVLPALWVYSFAVYIAYAPGPRAGYQFLACCLLPLGAAAATALLNRVLEGSNGRP
jgi:NhaP-type Na+/H+ or K+/H+ antiporter